MAISKGGSRCDTDIRYATKRSYDIERKWDRKMERRIIESERITNLDDYEKVIQEARTDMLYLKAALKRKDNEALSHLAEQLELKLHQLEAFEFQIERRTIIEHDHNECQ